MDIGYDMDIDWYDRMYVYIYIYIHIAFDEYNMDTTVIDIRMNQCGFKDTSGGSS